jgi:tripartite-type tricarboxylate transporter receptor subunit TctC
MIPYPAGGLSDIVARKLNGELGKHLNQAVIVENLGGASGSIAAQKVLNSPSDGYYIYQGSPNELILAPLAISAVKYKSEDWRAIRTIATFPIVLMVGAGLGVNNIDELAALGKKRAAEGKPLVYGSVGIGSFYHLIGENFSAMAGAKMTHVPYKGAADLGKDFLGGTVDIFFTPYGQNAQAMVDTGKIKFVGVLQDKRFDPIKAVPTASESQGFKSFFYAISSSYFVKKDTPEAIVNTLNAAFNKTFQNAEIRAWFASQGGVLGGDETLPEAQKFYQGETDKFRRIARDIKLEPQ